MAATGPLAASRLVAAPAHTEEARPRVSIRPVHTHRAYPPSTEAAPVPGSHPPNSAILPKELVSHRTRAPSAMVTCRVRRPIRTPTPALHRVQPRMYMRICSHRHPIASPCLSCPTLARLRPGACPCPNRPPPCTTLIRARPSSPGLRRHGILTTTKPLLPACLRPR
jgi:hypothetical protein